MAKPKKSKKTKKKATPSKRGKQATRKRKSRFKASAKSSRRKKPTRTRSRGARSAGELVGYSAKGLGAMAGGQAGDTQGISGGRGSGAESVAELLEEGQSFEAGAVAGVENAPDPDESEVVTREVSEDDVPEEYREED